MTKEGDIYIRNGYQLGSQPYLIIVISVFGDRIISRRCVDPFHTIIELDAETMHKYFEKVP